VTFRAGPRINITVSGDWESAGGSIIIPLHVNCRASSANMATLVKHKTSDAKMLVRNIDTVPNQSQHPTRFKWAGPNVISLDREIGNLDGTIPQVKGSRSSPQEIPKSALRS
jgi:hypothetical protein